MKLVLPAPGATLVRVVESVTEGMSSESYLAVRRCYCVGRNYWAHAVEMEEKQAKLGIGGDPREPPFFFQKPSFGAVVDTSTTPSVPYPSMTTALEFEAELVVALGKGGRDVSVAEAGDLVFGLGVGCDLTRRDRQNEAKEKRRPWDLAKAFDASAPCGPLLRRSAPLPPDAVMTLSCNGTVHQRTALDLMIFDVAECVAHLSKQVALEPGDLIFTGTPAGVGPLQVGDDVLCAVRDASGTDILPPCRFSVGPTLPASSSS